MPSTIHGYLVHALPLRPRQSCGGNSVPSHTLVVGSDWLGVRTGSGMRRCCNLGRMPLAGKEANDCKVCCASGGVVRLDNITQIPPCARSRLKLQMLECKKRLVLIVQRDFSCRNDKVWVARWARQATRAAMDIV